MCVDYTGGSRKQGTSLLQVCSQTGNTTCIQSQCTKTLFKFQNLSTHVPALYYTVNSKIEEGGKLIT